MLYVIGKKGDWQNAPIKIGYTDSSPESRLSSIQTGNPIKLVIVHLMEGSENDEKQIHKVLSNFRLAGEWFDTEKIPNDILDWILSCKSGIDAYHGTHLLLLGLKSELMSIQKAREKQMGANALWAAYEYIANIYAHKQVELLVRKSVIEAHIEASNKMLELVANSVTQNYISGQSSEITQAFSSAFVDEVKDISTDISRMKKDAHQWAHVVSQVSQDASPNVIAFDMLRSHDPQFIAKLISVLMSDLKVKRHYLSTTTTKA